MKMVQMLIALLMLAERVWKHRMVISFFQRPLPTPAPDPILVSTIQPVLSGDPTMMRYLERRVQLITLPQPLEGQNPKTVKLIAGAKAARGEVLC